jgi:hypothetical protein
MGILGGAIGGAVGAMAMTGLRQVTTGLGLVQRTPPEAAVQTAAPEVGQMPPGERKATIEVVHVIYGAAGGAFYGLLPDVIRRRTIVGLAYGAGAWTVFETFVAPRIGQEQEGGGSQQAALLADHLLYGAVLSRMAR